MDEGTKKTVAQIPLLTTKAGPRDGDAWIKRLKEEYTALIKYVEINKNADNDWFKLESNPLGTRWQGKCWFIHEFLKYEFDLEFDIPVTYPTTAPELTLPELDGKTEKMYRGGKICLTVHFKPLWARNVPHFGIAHALALGFYTHVYSGENASKQYKSVFIGAFVNCAFFIVFTNFWYQLAPWLAAEVPHLIETGAIVHPEKKR